jgi:hypothetical protein
MKRILILQACIFLSLLGCERESNCIVPEPCGLAPDAGPCKAYIPRYFYDKAEGKCKEFIWGGCGGVVPFNTLEECKACECAQRAG